jgi:hypothetical protein
MSKYVLAQEAPPAAPPPPMGGDMGMGGMGMDPMGGMGGAPTAPMSAPGAPAGQREEIGSPLNELGKILYDIDIQTIIFDKLGESADIALFVWTTYGGEETGKVNDLHVGKRIPKKDVSPEDEEKEQKRTEDRRWERLPKDTTIGDITSLEELSDTIKGIALNVSKNVGKAQGGGAPGMGGMASRYIKFVKVARNLDLEGKHYLVDLLDPS